MKFARALRRDWRVWIPLVLIAAIGFLIRFSAEQTHPGPSGADYGNYLTNVAILWGRDVTGAGLQYPPLYLGYLSFLLVFFPALTALQISGPLLTSFLTFPGYKLVRLYAGKGPALLGSAIICLADPFSELLGWGGGPQIFATVFIILFFYWGALALEDGGRRHAILAGLALSAVAGSHQLSLLYVLLLAALTGAGLVLTRRRKAWPHVRVGMQVIGFGVVFSLPYVPIYVAFASRLQPFAPPNLLTPDASSVVVNSAFVLSYSALWLPLILVAALAYSRNLTRAPVKSVVGYVLLIGPFLLTLTVFAYHPARPLYEVPIGVAPGLVAFLESVDKSENRLLRANNNLTRFSVAIVAAIILGGVTYASQARVNAAESYYYILGPGVLDGLTWLRDNASIGSKVITDGPPKYGIDELTGYQWAWWIQGFSSRMAYGTGTLPLQTYKDWVAQTDLANLYFAGRYVGENGYWRVGENGPSAAVGNPILFGRYAAGYKGAALFDDSAILLNVSGVTGSPFYWPGKGFSKSLTGGGLEMTITNTVAGATFERSSFLRDGVPDVTVNMTFSGSISMATVPLFTTSNALFSTSNRSSGKTQIAAYGDFQETNHIDVSIELHNATLLETNQLGGALPTYRLDFVFELFGSSSKVSFTFHVSPLGISREPGLRWTNTTTNLDLAGIDYVYVSTQRFRDLNRFLSDPEYMMVHVNSDIAIFQRVYS